MKKKKKSFYAVVRGRVPGIYESWEECKTQVLGYSGSLFKGFSTMDEAQRFLIGDDSYKQPSILEDPNPRKMQKTSIQSFSSHRECVRPKILSSLSQPAPQLSLSLSDPESGLSFKPIADNRLTSSQNSILSFDNSIESDEIVDDDSTTTYSEHIVIPDCSSIECEQSNEFEEQEYSDIDCIMKDLFKFEFFLPNQKEIILSILSG